MPGLPPSFLVAEPLHHRPLPLYHPLTLSFLFFGLTCTIVIVSCLMHNIFLLLSNFFLLSISVCVCVFVCVSECVKDYYAWSTAKLAVSLDEYLLGCRK